MAKRSPEDTPVTAETLSNCGLCHFSLWSREPSSDGREAYLELTSFADVSASTEEGCTGCKLLLHVWQYAIPEANDRQGSRLMFNTSNDNLWIRLFTKSGVHGLEVFTLPGECLSSAVYYHNLV
jgi:hypothetical protein